MLPIRIKACSESDLRMLGNLARNIQRVLPVTQADIDAAAALGKGWVVWKVIEVNDPIDNLRGGTQLVIKQNSVQPGQNVRRVLIVSGPGGETVVIGPGPSPLLLPNAIADSLHYVKAFGGTEQRDIPDNYLQRQFIYMMDGSYLLTDIVPTYDCKIEMDFQTTSAISQAATYLSSSTSLRFAHISAKTFRVNAWGDTYDSTTPVANDTRYKFTYNNLVATLKTGDTTIFTNTFTDTGTTTTPLTINGYGSPVSQNVEGIYLYSFKAWNAQGELVADYVPAIQKGTVPVVGFYDTVSKTFKTATAGTFAAGGEAVPTPDAPMDIISNNGVLKARHQSGLPLGYTLLDYIESSGTQYIDLGVKGNGNTKVSVEYRYHTNTSASGSGRVFGSRTTSSSNAFAIGSSSGVVSATANKAFWCYDAQSFFVIDGPAFPIGDWQTVVFSATEHTLNGVSYGDDYNVVEFETPQNLKLFGFDNGGTMGYGQVDVARCKLWDNGVLIRDLVPCKNASNVVGMYDLVNGVFYQNAGTGTFTAGNAVSDPVEIYTDGTVETIKDSLNNTATAEMLLKVGDYQDVQSIIDGVVTRKVGVKVLDGTEDWTASGNLFYAGIATDALEDTHSCYCTHFKGVATNASASYNNEIKVGTNATQTVNWTRVQMYPVVGTYSSVTVFKQWLADQYAAGTPVIVIYPLATPTTESVTGQTLQVTDGDNVLEITQASMSGLELEAQYQASVSLTIQEVQDANLDPNVEVTIN